VLATDVVIASTDARLGDAHSNYGLIPRRRFGPAAAGARPHRAKYLAFTGDFSHRPHPYWPGWSRKSSNRRPHARLHELADRLATKSPAGLAAMKRLIDTSADLSRRRHRRRAAGLSRALPDPGFPRGLTAFAEKRARGYST